MLTWLGGVCLTLFGVDLAGALGWLDLPSQIALAESPVVLAVCAVLALIECLTDKIPGVDSIGDLLHPLVRIPAGADLGVIALSTEGGEVSVIGLILAVRSLASVTS